MLSDNSGSDTSSLRSAEICAGRLFSSTTVDDHAADISSSLVTSSPWRSTSSARRSSARDPTSTATPRCVSSLLDGTSRNAPKRNTALLPLTGLLRILRLQNNSRDFRKLPRLQQTTLLQSIPMQTTSTFFAGAADGYEI